MNPASKKDIIKLLPLGKILALKETILIGDENLSSTEQAPRVESTLVQGSAAYRDKETERELTNANDYK